MMYKDYLKKVELRFNALFEGIAAHYNFDYGDEFEIALCQALRTILPQRYGICRGFVVTAENTSAGDDIIIYDRDRFPTLRLLSQECYDRKEFIPIEALCAYIEAKYTVCINGEGPQSLFKACSQVASVKNLHREGVPLNAYDPYVNNGAFLATRANWPEILNPIYGAVLAMRVRSGTATEILEEPAEIRTALSGTSIEVSPFPDLIIAGNSNIILPFISEGESLKMHSPFHLEGKTTATVFHVDKLAFSIGICTLLYALDTLRLGKMPWPNIINEGINTRV